LKALPQGQYIKHYRYGYGVVTESDLDGITTIEFETNGAKKFVTELMQVDLSDLTPAKHLRAKWVRTASARRSPRKPASRKAAFRIAVANRGMEW
jgi:hypothetical protein